MALSDLEIFSEEVYTSLTEVLDQQVDKFNAASDGTIILQSGSIVGDYRTSAFYSHIDGLVRRRNPYGTGTVGTKSMQHMTDVMVKVASGTPEILMNASDLAWLNRDAKEYANVFAVQLSKQMMAEMLNVSLGIGVAAISQIADLVLDDTTGTNIKPSTLAKATKLFGDRASDIRAFVAHSHIAHDFVIGNLNNGERLFDYGNVAILRDVSGRSIIMTDSPSLVEADGISSGVDKYSTLGLTSNAIVVQQEGDFNDNYETSNGNDNIKRTYQAEWSNSYAIKGYQWDKTNGGAAPNDAALFTSSNWDKNVTSNKDTAGVLIQNRTL